MIREILLGTPAWVYLLLALLLWLGVCQLRPRAVPVQRIWRTPMVFIVWGLCGLALRNSGMLTSTLPWLIGASVGLLAGVARPNTLAIDHARRLVMRPASALPLLRNFMIFAAHYALNVAAAFRPDRHEIMQVDTALSGVFAGFFLGWLIRFVQHYELVLEFRSPSPRSGSTNAPVTSPAPRSSASWRATSSCTVAGTCMTGKNSRNKGQDAGKVGAASVHMIRQPEMRDQFGIWRDRKLNSRARSLLQRREERDEPWLAPSWHSHKWNRIGGLRRTDI